MRVFCRINGNYQSWTFKPVENNNFVVGNLTYYGKKEFMVQYNKITGRIDVWSYHASNLVPHNEKTKNFFKNIEKAVKKFSAANSLAA